MTDVREEKLKILKQKFKSLSMMEREQVSVCFLKVKLGVNNPDELRIVKQFLGDIVVTMSPDNLDHVITYLHSDSLTLPEFIAMEESLTEIEAKSGLPSYNAEDVDTLREAIKPFK